MCTPQADNGNEGYEGICPVGSYSDEKRPGKCIPCPEHMTTL